MGRRSALRREVFRAGNPHRRELYCLRHDALTHLRRHLDVITLSPRHPSSEVTMSATRRDFLKSMAAGMLTTTGGLAFAAKAPKRLATDWVTLGNSGVKVTRLALGTGTISGKVQRDLGQDEFTRQVRHAYDSGIRFFETAESYHGMPEMLGIALKGIPRDSYRLMTKYTVRPGDDPKAKIDTFRKQVGTEYFDILLIHCVRSPEWP